MPNVNGKEFDYGTAGVKAAKKEAAKTGKKISYNYGRGGVVPKGKKEKEALLSGVKSGVGSGLKSGAKSGAMSGIGSGLSGISKAVEDDMKKAGKASDKASGKPKKYAGGGVVRGAGAATRGTGFYKG